MTRSLFLALPAALCLLLAGPAPTAPFPQDRPDAGPAPAKSDQPAAPAEPPKVTGPDVVPEHTLARLTVTGIPPGHAIIWDVDPSHHVSKSTNARLKSVLEFTAPPGVYEVQVWGVKDENVVEATRTVTIQARTPAPPAPTPPGPTPPGPAPPQPAPPIAGEGNRVLIVYETGQQHTPAQAAVFTSGVLRDYLDARTVKDEHNPNGAYRIWDKDVNLNHPSVSSSWKAAMARPRQSLPWILVSNGRTGYEGPLPPDVPQTLALLRKYLGD